MNPKITEYREERDKNTARIERLNARNEWLTQKIIEMEHTDLFGLLDQYNMTPDALATYLARQMGRPVHRELPKEVPDDEKT